MTETDDLAAVIIVKSLQPIWIWYSSRWNERHLGSFWYRIRRLIVRSSKVSGVRSWLRVLFALKIRRRWRLPNFKAILAFQHKIQRFWDFPRSYDNTAYRKIKQLKGSTDQHNSDLQYIPRNKQTILALLWFGQRQFIHIIKGPISRTNFS